MTEPTDAEYGEEALAAVLEGGPTDLPQDLRAQQVPSSEWKLKVQHHGGYEHFEREGQATGPTLGSAVIFRWTMRTRIAE